MLSVIFNWIYIGVTTFILGYGFSGLLSRCLGYSLKRLDSIFMTGLVIATVYAQLFSLFYKVGALANIVMLVGCVVITCIFRKQLFQDLGSFWNNTGTIRKWVVLIVFLLWAFLGCQGFMHYDTGLYHAQSIRWIEEYGVVKGLVNLHTRLAYNSSLFAVSALYSMKFLLGRSLHDVNGWIAFLLTLSVLDLGNAWKRKKLNMSDFASIASIYYLTMIHEEVISPASDYATMCMVFYIIIKWLRQLEQEDAKNPIPYGLLCVAGVFTMTLKLTTGLILLLTIKPAYDLLKAKKWKDIAFFISCGMIVLAFWMTRTVLISGWLLYPFSGIDLFSVDWKLPVAEVNLDAACIKAWGRGIYNAYLVNTPLKEWWINWFRTILSRTEKLIILGDMGTLAVFVLFAGWALLKKQKKYLDLLLVLFTVECSYVFWQLNAPLPRYGYAYMLLPLSLCGGFLVSRLKNDMLVRCIVVICGLYKLWGIGQYATTVMADTSIYGWQLSYTDYEVVEFCVDDQVFYAPAELTDQTGYEAFPGSYGVHDDFALRGKDLKDGLRRIEQP